MPDKLRTYLTQNAKPLPGWDAFKAKMMAMTAKTRLTPALLQSQHNGDPEFVCRILATELVHKLPFADLEQIFAFAQTSLVDENEVETLLFEARLNPIGDGQLVANQDRFNAVKYEPEVVSHPGQTLADKIDEMQISTTTFSERSGLSVKMLWDLMNRKQSITVEIAEALELVTSIPAHLWIACQARYDVYVAKVEEAKKQEAQDPANEYKPETVTHPGVALAEKMTEMQIGVDDFAGRAGLVVGYLRRVLSGDESIHGWVVARRIAEVTGTKPALWMARQSDYDDYLAKIEEE